jgi:GTP pyrophosphokinase
MSIPPTDLRRGSAPALDRVAVLAELTARLSDPDQALVARALDFARVELEARATADGEPALAHAVGTASVLTGLPLAGSAVAAALLHDVPHFVARSEEKLRQVLSADVASLVDGVARMGEIQALTGGVASGRGREDGAQLESLRKMLLAMVQDIRVVLIKLAEQTQRLRYLVKSGEEVRRQAAARETLDLLAPLANRLGVWQFKWELEDLSFRILEPAVYKEVARQVDEKRAARERYIGEAIATLKGELVAAGIAGEISGRPKHIYSIHKKMHRKSVDFAEIYDARAMRVLVPEVTDCYAVLGIVHNLWTPLPQEFDDYIAKPKPNGYRSLHTAVIGPDGRALEIQVRTHEMHRHAELGVAAHWRYKEGSGGRATSYDDKIAWLRRILEWPDEVPDSAEIAERFKTELFRDTVYVFTPQGQVIALPRGATPVDFAYHVHTELGHRCRGAKVDGAMVPLNYALANAQRVEIVAAKSGGPSRDWLNPLLGYLVSARARSKVRQWFNSQNLQSAVALGRSTVEREAHRVGVALPALEALAQRLGFAKVEDCLVAVGRGEIGLRQLQVALRGEAGPKAEQASIVPARARATGQGDGVLVVGVENLLTALGKCCKPAPPDPIIGFVTRGRGISVHRRDCRNLRSMPDERMIAAAWGRTAGQHFPVDLRIEARDRRGLLRDISEILSRERINVTATDTLSRGDFASMRFTVEVEDADQLAKVLGLIRDVGGVTRAERG